MALEHRQENRDGDTDLMASVQHSLILVLATVSLVELAGNEWAGSVNQINHVSRVSGHIKQTKEGMHTHSGITVHRIGTYILSVYVVIYFSSSQFWHEGMWAQHCHIS